MTAEKDWTFEQAMASKAETNSRVTDEQWYVVLVAQCCILYEGVDPFDFKFSITPPNPEIMAHYELRTPPHIAAIELFAVRH
jgi:hypothetical protein